MIATDVYGPDQWYDFFVMVGGGAAVLTGLVFVAMSLNLDVVARDATHRYRAIGTLSGFTAAFMICALSLLGGQDNRAVGAEWLVVSTVAGAIYVYGYLRAIRTGESSVGLRPRRLIGGAASYAAQIVGAVILIMGHIAGLYLAAVSLIAYVAFMISGAWLLLMGIHEAKGAPAAE